MYRQGQGTGAYRRRKVSGGRQGVWGMAWWQVWECIGRRAKYTGSEYSMVGREAHICGIYTEKGGENTWGIYSTQNGKSKAGGSSSMAHRRQGAEQGQAGMGRKGREQVGGCCKEGSVAGMVYSSSAWWQGRRYVQAGR